MANRLLLMLAVASATLQTSATCPHAASGEVEGVVFETQGFRIHGDLYLPEGEGPHPAILIVHGDGRGTRNYYRTARGRFLDAGYAVLIWDKPGFGDSTGEFSADRTISERTDILCQAVATLQSQPKVDGERIGTWGVSQAGYVIPMAIQRGARIAFMILVGAPGENGVQQTAYFVGRQARCEGYSVAQSAEVDSLAAAVMAARTHSEYADYGRVLLNRYPIVKHIDFMAGILPEDRWSPRDPHGEAFFDPMPIIDTLTIPVLAFFGELDKNVDPVQGSDAYGVALARAGHPSSHVEVLPGVDHDMVPSETGCMRERYSRRSWRVSSKYLDAMHRWLTEIRDVLRKQDRMQ
jgi:pimeloyl-ACP methyl ester carboxylesterase